MYIANQMDKNVEQHTIYTHLENAVQILLYFIVFVTIKTSTMEELTPNTVALAQPTT